MPIPTPNIQSNSTNQTLIIEYLRSVTTLKAMSGFIMLISIVHAVSRIKTPAEIFQGCQRTLLKVYIFTTSGIGELNTL